MRSVSLLLAAVLGLTSLLAPTPQDPAAPERPQDITAQYHALAAAGDADGLVELWRANEGRVLGTIDRDLEGSLSIWEAAAAESTGAEVELDAASATKIAELLERALFGGRAASEAFDRPIFADYAASFASWGANEKRAFRAGQAAYGEARNAFGEGRLEAARDAAERCTALALPLGDWWGAAMGLGASGNAKLELGDLDGAIADLARARLLDQALGLGRSERRDLEGMLTCLERLERWQRAKAVCAELLAISASEELDALAQRAAAIEAEL